MLAMVTLIAEGGQKYFNGYPCLRCGSAVRYVSNRKCVNCQIDAAASHKEEIKIRRAGLSDVEEKMRGVWYGE